MRRIIYCIVLVGGSTAFLTSRNSRLLLPIQRVGSLKMALTPIGPFCPFRSSASIEAAPKVESWHAQTPEFATELARIQLDMQLGKTPNSDTLINVAREMDLSVDRWESLIAQFRQSGDFQTKEYATFIEAHLQSYGVSSKGIAAMMKWQSGCMKAMAFNRPPPMPPSELDLNQLMAQSQQQKKPPSMLAMSSAEKVTTPPFSENDSIFDTNPMVKEEYTKLCRDHANLIEMGAKYASFDSSGRMAYLDAIDLISERWDIFFARFSLMGKLSTAFLKQCDSYLASMGLNEDDYKALLKKAHILMRKEAEKD